MSEGVSFERLAAVVDGPGRRRRGIGDVGLGPIRAYAFEQIRQAHADMEQNRTFGKMVVTISP